MTVYKNRITQARTFSRRLPVLELSHEAITVRLFSSTLHFAGCVLLHNKTIIALFDSVVNALWLYWCPYTESNCKLRITKPSLYHLTIRAILKIWWTVPGSNRGLKLAKLLCSQLYQQPNILLTFLKFIFLKFFFKFLFG